VNGLVDYFYRFDDRAAMLAAIEPLGMTYTDADGNAQPSQGSHQFALWEVGTLSGYDGWHLNIRLVDESFDVSTLASYEVVPKNPRVIWA
jgi:hypothetical protein